MDDKMHLRKWCKSLENSETVAITICLHSLELTAGPGFRHVVPHPPQEQTPGARGSGGHGITYAQFAGGLVSLKKFWEKLLLPTAEEFILVQSVKFTLALRQTHEASEISVLLHPPALRQMHPLSFATMRT